MPRIIDLTGRRFYRWTVLGLAPSEKGKPTRWYCQCDCGNIKDVPGSELVRGASKSCGCYKSEKAAAAHWKHGGKGTRLYKVWLSMHNRCRNQNSRTYKYYGGRGITVCEEWHDFNNFAAWAYENGYDPDAKRGVCTIDRINNNGNYEPSNCRWVSMSVQRINQRKRGECNV